MSLDDFARAVVHEDYFCELGRGAIDRPREARAVLHRDHLHVALEPRQQVVETYRGVIDHDHLVVGLGGQHRQRLEAAQRLLRPAL